MGFRLTLFSLKNKSSRTLDKNVPKIRNEGCLTKSGNISFKCKCVKYSLVLKLIRKLIAYYMAHFSIVKNLMVTNSHILMKTFIGILII